VIPRCHEFFVCSPAGEAAERQGKRALFKNPPERGKKWQGNRIGLTVTRLEVKRATQKKKKKKQGNWPGNSQKKKKHPRVVKVLVVVNVMRKGQPRQTGGLA